MRILMIAGKAVLVLVLTLSAALLLMLAIPSWFLNSRTAALAAHRFGSAYRPTWKELSLNVGSLGFLTKRIFFHATDLCVGGMQGTVRGCFPELDLDATIHLDISPFITVRRLENLTVRSDALKIDTTVEPVVVQVQGKKQKLSFELLPSPVRSMTIGKIDIHIPEAVVISSSGTMVMKLDMQFLAEESEPLRAEAYLVTRGSAPSAAQHYSAALQFDSDILRKGKLSYVDAWVKFHGDNGLAGRATAKVTQGGKDELRLSGRAEAHMAGRRFSAIVAGSTDPSRYAAKANVSVDDPSGPVRSVRFEKCVLNAPLDTESGLPEKLDLKCGVTLVPAYFSGVPGAPSALKGALSAGAVFNPRNGEIRRDAFTADVALTIGPEKRWYDFNARLDAKLSGRTSRLSAMTIEHRMETSFNVARFEDMVRFLENTRFAVPAPLNAMKGPLAFEANSSGNPLRQTLAVKYTFTSDLASVKQKLKTKVQGTVAVSGLSAGPISASDKTEVEIKDIALQMPPLKLGKVPSPMIDSRIKTGNPGHDASVEAMRHGVQASTASAIQYEAHVFTDKPLLIYSNLLKDPVPISLDLHLAPAGMSGRIRIEPFNVKVFRQTARVDHIQLTPSPGTTDMGLDGKIVYKKEDTTIDILLLGNTRVPQVTFDSDPPMTQEEIISLLLYDKSPVELDSDEAATAGNTSTAFTDGAFGLASLFLFASTPIDSVSYDPATQTYQVRFKLPGGATFGVGSDLEDSRTLSLQKRLGRQFEVETDVERSAQEGDTITTFLEWFTRY